MGGEADAGADAGAGAGADAGTDAGIDAGTDGGIDEGTDGGELVTGASGCFNTLMIPDDPICDCDIVTF